jgi:hypothetical protein
MHANVIGNHEEKKSLKKLRWQSDTTRIIKK